MLYTHYKSVSFELDIFFPKKKAIQIFNNYLKSFLLQEYSLNPQIKQYHQSFLELHLRLFSQLNPEFGKRIFVRRRRNIHGNSIYTYNDTVNYDPFTSNLIPSSHLYTNHTHYENELYPNNLTI